jgi:hypothetical protein
MNIWPYTNFHEMNLDWILQAIKDMNEELRTFINVNTIKYADPIKWNITRQYEANTVVVDDAGTAYLSVKAVPSGISISRTEYWTEIGNFSKLWISFKSGITPYDVGASTTATDNYPVNTLVWVKDTLRIVTKTMTAGDKFTDSNSTLTSVNAELEKLRTHMTIAETNLAKEIADRKAADETLTNSVNQNANNIAAEITARKDAITKETNARIAADKALQEQIEAVSSTTFANIKDYGAVGNGTADDTAAIKKAIASGLPLLFPDGTYSITSDVALQGAYFSYGAMVVASGCVVTVSAPIAGASCHFRKANNGHIKMTDAVVLVDWFNYQGDLGNAISNYLSGYEGVVKFGRPATYAGLGSDTPYVVSGNIYLQPHTTYDLQGCIIKLTTANGGFKFNGTTTGHVERTIFRNGVIIGATDGVDAAFTSAYSERFFIEDLFVIGCRKVLECIHTINMQVRNIIHDIALPTSKPVTSYHLVEDSTGATGISGNASFRAENCISSLGSATGDRWMFIADSSSDIRDIYISNCECSNSNGIWINSNATPSTVWDILIDGFIADQCPQVGIYLTNCLHGAVHIFNSYANALSYGIRLVGSTAVINTCQFLATASMNGIYIEGGCRAVSINHCTFIDVPRPIQIADGVGTIVNDITVTRTKLYGENAPAVFVGSEWCIITRLSGWNISPAYTAGVQFGAGNCTFGFINGFDPTKYSKLGEPTNIQQISTAAI